MKPLIIFLFVITLSAFAGDTPASKNDSSVRLEKRIPSLEKGVNQIILSWSGTGVAGVSAGFLVTADTFAEVVIAGMGINTGAVMGLAACYFSFKNLSLKTD